MLSYLSRPAAFVLLALASSLTMAPATLANESGAVRSGTEVLADYKDAIKTSSGKKEVRRIQVIYNWDEGATYTYTYDSAGAKADTKVVYGSPTPSDEEVAEAIAIVEAYPDVVTIKQRQAGIAIDGGFPFRLSSGVCARPARCLQMFLFDAENVVRHMLVDMRTRTVVDSDYIPPQNREAN